MNRTILALTGLATLAAAATFAPEVRARSVSDVACAPMAERMALEGRPSPYDSTFVALGSGQVKICYGRPSARGRTMIGGEPHPFGEPWRLGANEPTTLHTEVALRIGEMTVTPGSYSLYAIPGEESWEIVVNRSVDRWGIPISGAVRAEDIGSVRVPRERPSAPVETLTLTFGTPTGGSVPLVIEWESFRVTLPVGLAS